MNTKNDQYTPRERVHPDLLRELLEEAEPGNLRAAQSVSAYPKENMSRSVSCPRCAQRAEKRTCVRSTCEKTYCSENCTDPKNSVFPSLAMVYSPVQEFTDLYDPEEGLCRGTIFKQLDKPLTVGKCQERRWNV